MHAGSVLCELFIPHASGNGGPKMRENGRNPWFSVLSSPAAKEFLGSSSRDGNGGWAGSVSLTEDRAWGTFYSFFPLLLVFLLLGCITEMSWEACGRVGKTKPSITVQCTQKDGIWENIGKVVEGRKAKKAVPKVYKLFGSHLSFIYVDLNKGCENTPMMQITFQAPD